MVAWPGPARVSLPVAYMACDVLLAPPRASLAYWYENVFPTNWRKKKRSRYK